MAQWIIYGSNGVAKVKVKELELHDEWMAECFITINVKSATPIVFAVGDYIDYRGERYTIQYDPNVLKKATSGSYGEGFTYDNIKFVGLQDEVVRCDFNDIVLNDNNIHYTTLPTFPFYCETVDDLLDRIQANLEDLYPGQWIIIGLNTVRNTQRGTAVGRALDFTNAYKQYIDPAGTEKTDPYGKTSVAETVDNITCWDALKKVHDDFDLNFIIRGRVIIVGTTGVFTANTFRYGKGNGLYEIERIGESDQRIVTRLRAYGSEENLPAHYYSSLNKKVYATVTTIKDKFGTEGAHFLLDLNFASKYFTYRSESYPGSDESPNYIIEMKANNVTVKGFVTNDSETGKCYVYCESSSPQEDDRDEPDAIKMAAFVAALAQGNRLDFVDYVKKDVFGEDHYDYAEGHLPDNMAVSRLMLPGFPTQSLAAWVNDHKDDEDKEWLAQAISDGFTFSSDAQRPYIDSPNISRYGIRPASIYFDGSDETENIRPTIEGMTYDSEEIDEVYSADQISDNGVYAAGTTVPNFNITLPDLGFDLKKVYQDGASIDMKNGMCGARSFKMASMPTQDSTTHRWTCEVNRSHDESLDLWFPYNDFQITSGDKYLLVGIEMPDAYIEAAAIKLLQASIEALKKNHAPRYTYQPRIDELWMQRQHDTATNTQGVVSLHDTLKAGDIFAFADTDLNIDANIVIDVLTIKENGNNGLPTYEVTLRNEKQVETIQKITNKIDSVISGDAIFGGGGSMAMQQYQSLIDKNIQGKYLSRQKDDNAEGVITFNKGVKIGQYHSRFLDSGAAVDPAGNAEFESIYSRSFISAPEFRFNRISVTEGEQWCTNGYGTIESVVEGKDENGNTVTNGGLITLHLEENDFASVAAGDICRGIYNDIAGTYNPPAMDNDASYAAGTSAQEGDGIGFSAKRGFFTSYFYIDRIVKSNKGECQFIYKLRSSTTPHPCAYMKFAQYGSFTDATRRASSYATSIGHYYEMVLEGVQTWTIESANVVYRKGYLGDLVIELADGTSRQLQGYGLYAQNNVYFGNAVIQLDPYTLEMLEEDLSTYDVSFGEHVDMIVVDDTGNVIGGIYTETEEGGVTTREYRIHSAITVRKKGTLLTEALAGAEAGLGTYKINFTPVGCSAMIENSTMYITGIDHVKDGVAGSGDDTDFDYDAMRAVDSCRVDFTIDCEGKTSIQKSIPIAIKHDSQPFVGADITNEFSAVSWNTKTQSYVGLPITLDFKMWHNDEVLDITSVDDISVSPSITGMTVAKSIVENASGNKVAHIVISALPANLGLVTDLEITCVATYSGVRYERTLVHTINKSTDTNVYSLIPSVDEVIVNKNTGGLSSNSVDISVVCDSSDNKHYAVAYNQFGTHQLCICYKKFYTDGTSDANETEYTGTAVSVDSSVERVSFFLYKKVGTTIDTTVLHDKEDVPIIANGQDGKGVEYIFITQNTETPVPTINDVAADRQVDNYCPYTDAQHTAQWTDEPTGVASNAKFEFYAQRKKVNGVWQEFGEVKLWNRYVVDGVTPYIIDLSNEQSMVACNESGTVVGSYETSNLMLFYGQSYAFNDFAITITPTNITCNDSAVAFTLTAEQKAAAQAAGYFTLTPSAITADSATIAVTATMGNIVLSAVYKVNKAYAGKNGVIYSLLPSLDTIRKNKSGSLVDQTLTLQVKKTVGAEATILTTAAQLSTEGLTLKYENASTESPVTITDAVSIATNSFVGTNGTWGKIILIKSNVIVDAERINVVSDGVDGQSSFKSTCFIRTNVELSSRPTGGNYASPKPTSTVTDGETTLNWEDGIPSGSAKLWAVTRIFTADGKAPQQSQWSVPRPMTDTATYDVEFAKKQTNDATPADPDDTNRHGGSDTQIWFDPVNDSEEDFTAMYWRAERECINGTWGSWTICRIKGEKGDSVKLDLANSYMEYAISQYGEAGEGRDYPSDISTWSRTVPSSQQGKFLWTKDVTAYTDAGVSKTTTTYGVSYYGTDGNSVEIDTANTFVKYSTQKTSSKPADSTFTLDNPPTLAQGDYLWCLSQTKYVGVNSPLKSYSVSRVGTDGNQGDEGPDGYTTHFAYATSADGSQDFSTTNFSGATYIGTYRDQEADDSEVYTDYTWTQWKGDKGDSALIADLTNEMDSVAMDVSGNVLSETTLATTFKIYFGSTAQTLTSLTSSGAATGVTVSCDATTGIVTIVVDANATLTNDKNVITLTGVCAKGTRTAEFTISGVRSGSNGVTPTLFNILPSVDAIKRDKDNTLTPSSITCTVQKVHGTTVSTAAAGDGTLRYSVDGDITASDQGTELTLGGTVNYTSSNSYITFAYFVGGVMRDKERVPIVYDGKNGDKGNGIVLTLTRDNYTEENWATYAVVGENENFSYSGGVTVRVGDYFIVKGTSTDKGLMHTATFKCTSQISTGVFGDCISHICDGEKGDQGDDGIYYEEEYAIGSSRSSHDSLSWSSGSVTPTDANPYVWKRSRSVNPNTTPYTYGSWVYVCLTGATGQVGNTGPMYYPAGIHDPNKAYSVTAQLVPVVCSGSGNTASYYYAKQSISAGQNIPVTNTKYWQAFSTFAATFINVLFASFAKLGSFVIKDNWFISQYGTVNGNNSANYEAFNGNFTNQTTNFIPYLAFDAKNGTIFGEKGTIGGFTIGATSLGTSQITGQEDGYTFIRRDGKINVWCSSTSDYALQVNGSVNLITNAQGQSINMSCPSGDININASNLNLNTSANNQNVVNIGSTQSASVNIYGGEAKFSNSTPVNVGSSLAVSGIASLGGNIISGSGTKTLPQTPKIGEFYFCKGTSGDMTIQVKSGTSHKIQMSSSGSENTSISINRDAHILVYMETNKWVDFKCN